MRLTVLTPTTGRACLLEAIQSVRAQTYPDVEHLIYHDLKGQGWGSIPRRLMARWGTGEYCLHLDDDNLLYPEACANVVGCLEKHDYPEVLIMPFDWNGRRQTAEKCARKHVDTLQIVCRTGIARQWPETKEYEADGVFADWLASYVSRIAIERDAPSIGLYRSDPRLLELQTERRMGVYDDGSWDYVGGLMELIRSLPCRLERVAEVGCGRGVSTEVFLRLCGHVHAIDPDDSFLSRVGHYPNLTYHKASSPEAAGLFPDGYFDLVYIDALHDEASVRADIAAWRLKSRWLSGHDYGIPEVRKAVDELGTVKVFEDTSWLYERQNP